MFRRPLLLLLLLLPVAFAGCRVYSFSGATIEGKTIYMHVLENRARLISPTAAPAMTDKVRSRIVSQTGLSPVTGEADYELSGYISEYSLSVSGLQQTQQATQNRLTIALNITFKNRLNPKADFAQTFTRFADFSATQSLQAVESRLIDDIGSQLADDIFNKAFVNW